jgi:SH3 domain protein
MHNMKIIFISMLCLLANIANAETIYVIDELKIGLHEDPTIDSPIMKLVPSGTALTVIERNENLVHVQEPEGVRGWINNKYVITAKPDKARVSELEKEIELLKSATTGDGTDTQKEISQQLISERLKSGDLQAKLADLKAKIANVDNSEQFIADIEQLKLENIQLISQLESSGIDVQTEVNSGFVSLDGWKQLISSFILILILGMVAGAFTLDHINRRRHGGFRI